MLAPPGSPTIASTRLLRQAFTMGSVTKATPIHFIDSKSRIKKRRDRKTAVSSYYACPSRDLLLVASGADTHTHILTHIHQCSRTKRFQETRRPRAAGPLVPGLKMICMHCYAFLSDKSLFTWLPFDVIIINGTVVKLMSAWFLDSELSTYFLYPCSCLVSWRQK